MSEVSSCLTISGSHSVPALISRHHTECCVTIDSKQTLSALQRWIPVFLLCSFTQHSVWHQFPYRTTIG